MKQSLQSPWAICICIYLPYVIFLFYDVVLLCSSVLSDASGAMKTITYGGMSDSGQDISLLCGKLITTLERLELLNEVCSLSFILSY